MLPAYSRTTKAAIVGMAIVALAVFYFLFSPAETAWMPRCVIRALTGYDCPGCGSQRALHALLHGRVAEAAGYNLLVLPALGYLALLGACYLMPKRLGRLHGALTSTAACVVWLAVIVVWWVVRNLVVSC